jgi:cobalamin biosynthesis protein CobT
VFGTFAKEMRVRIININLDEDQPQVENMGQDPYNPQEKLFNSDSETSSNSEKSATTATSSKPTKNTIDYANYTKLFEKIPSAEHLSTKSSTSFILEDYNTFKRKISSKKSLHK